MAKIGLDDFFIDHSLEDFLALPDLSIEEILDSNELLEFEARRNNQKLIQAVPPLIGGRKRDDIGNGERFVDQHGKITRWSVYLGWRHYDGIRWRDNIDRSVERMAEETARSIFVEAARTRNQDDAAKIAAWAIKSSSMNGIKNMLESAKNKSGMAVDHEHFDKDRWLFNLRNGTYDLRTGEFREHRDSDFITKYSDVEYLPEAECPVWRKFLARVIPNHETARYLQKCAGYSLTGSIDEQCFFLLYGTGKNGKSKFLEGIAAVLGEYGNVMRTEALMASKFIDIRGDTAMLRGLRFAYTVEPVSNAVLNTAFIKQQTGGEKLIGKFLYRDQFAFAPTHKLWIGSNEDIKIFDTDEGIKRRVKQIPFKVWIPEAERDQLLGHKFMLELSGILNWVLDGLKMFLSEGLGMPPEVKEATDSYFERINPLTDFIKECCTLDGSIRTALLHKRYLEYAKEAGEKKPFGRRKFSQLLASKNFEIITIRGTDYWQKISLNDHSYNTQEEL